MRPYQKLLRMQPIRSSFCANNGEIMVDKPFKTIDEQLKILDGRGLIISNRESAHRTLSRYGYYEVINGYKDPFMISKNDDDGFKENITFEHLARLQECDRNIRFSIVTALEIFEENLRQSVANVISNDISYIQQNYIRRENFSTGRRYYNTRIQRNIYPVDDLIYRLNKAANSEKEPVKHYRENHGNVPPWILVKELSFGNLVWLTHLLKEAQKDKVLSEMLGFEQGIMYQLMQRANLKKWFHEALLLFLSYRNAAAHGGRMYNHIAAAHELSYNQVFHKVFDITEADYRRGIGRSRIGTLHKVLAFFSNKDPLIRLEVGLNSELERYFKLYPDDKLYMTQEMQYDTELDSQFKD